MRNDELLRIRAFERVHIDAYGCILHGPDGPIRSLLAEGFQRDRGPRLAQAPAFLAVGLPFLALALRVRWCSRTLERMAVLNREGRVTL